MANMTSQDEIDAAVKEKHPEAAQRRVITYNWKHPSRVSKDQTRTLENLHSNLPRMMASSFSNLARSVVDCEIAFVEQTTYAGFIMSLSNPSCSYTFTIEPLGGPAIMDFSLPVAYSFIDRESTESGRPVTAIERTVMTRVVTRALADLEATWEALLKIQVTDAALETNPEFMQVAAPSDTVILIAFEVNSQHASGLVNLCYPYFTLQPVMAYLNVQTWASRERRSRRTGDHEKKQLLRSLSQVKTNLRVELGRGEIPAASLADLQVGDTIVLNSRSDDPAVLFVEDEPLFLVRPGLDEGKNRNVVQVEQAIPIEERIHHA